jgi:predicted transcriptional regulator of viral defense system
MIYDSLVKLVGAMEYFDMPLLVQGFPEPRESIRVQLSRWMKDGKVIGFRRGIYTLPDTYRSTSVAPAGLANHLYHPSYLSSLWALNYYDMIPEAVVWLTSVTTRVPRRFKNSFGTFDYRNIKKMAFFGYTTVPYAGHEILVAEPEKALLDHWHLTLGEWTPERIEEMRYQHYQQVNESKLLAYTERFNSPRLNRAVERWLVLTAEEEKGTVTL